MKTFVLITILTFSLFIFSQSTKSLNSVSISSIVELSFFLQTTFCLALDCIVMQKSQRALVVVVQGSLKGLYLFILTFLFCLQHKQIVDQCRHSSQQKCPQVSKIGMLEMVLKTPLHCTHFSYQSLWEAQSFLFTPSSYNLCFCISVSIRLLILEIFVTYSSDIDFQSRNKKKYFYFLMGSQSIQAKLSILIWRQGMQVSNAFARKRVQNERKQITQNPPANWKINNEIWNQWQVIITAQSNCPFHLQPIKLIVRFSDKYPYQKPEFILPEYHKFYHPNINPNDGSICEQTIKTNQPTLTVRKRIDCFVFLLAIPNPDSYLNSEAASQYKTDYKKYYRKAIRRYVGA